MYTVKYIKKVGGRIALGVCQDGLNALYNISEVEYISLGSPMREEQLSEEQMDKVTACDAARRAMKKALTLLSFGDKSKSELYKKLRSAGYCDRIARECVAECVRLGYIDEQRQLHFIISREANVELRGPAYIRRKLYQRGYHVSDIDAVTRQLCDDGDIDFSESLKKLAQKRGVSDDEGIKALAYKYGFSHSNFD